jgi:hypothetical protein
VEKFLYVYQPFAFVVHACAHPGRRRGLKPEAVWLAVVKTPDRSFALPDGGNAPFICAEHSNELENLFDAFLFGTNCPA